MRGGAILPLDRATDGTCGCVRFVTRGRAFARLSLLHERGARSQPLGDGGCGEARAWVGLAFGNQRAKVHKIVRGRVGAHAITQPGAPALDVRGAIDVAESLA